MIATEVHVRGLLTNPPAGPSSLFTPAPAHKRSRAIVQRSIYRLLWYPAMDCCNRRYKGGFRSSTSRMRKIRSASTEKCHGQTGEEQRGPPPRRAVGDAEHLLEQLERQVTGRRCRGCPSGAARRQQAEDHEHAGRGVRVTMPTTTPSIAKRVVPSDGGTRQRSCWRPA